MTHTRQNCTVLLMSQNLFPIAEFTRLYYIVGHLPQESLSTAGSTTIIYDLLWSTDHCIFGHVDSDVGIDVPILSFHAAVGRLSRGIVESFAGWYKCRSSIAQTRYQGRVCKIPYVRMFHRRGVLWRERYSPNE